MPFVWLHVNEDPSSAISTAEKEEVDLRSIYVGNVRLQLFFLCLKCVCLVYVIYLFERMFVYSC